MSSRIGYGIFCIVVRQIVVGTAGIPRIKRKFQHLHARKTAFLHQTAHRIRHIPKILGNDLLPAKSLLHFPEQVNARSLFPVSVHGRIFTVRNGIILVKAAEMIDAHDIVKPETMGQS